MATGTIKTNPVQTGTCEGISAAGMTSNTSNISYINHLALLNVNIRKTSGFASETWVDVLNISPAPSSDQNVIATWGSNNLTIRVYSTGVVSVYAHNANFTGFARVVIPFFF